MRAALNGNPIAGLALILLTLYVPSPAADTQALDASLCALVAHPKAFNKKRVRVRAHVESNGVDLTGLVDDSCKGGIALWTAKDTRANPDQKALDNAIFRQGFVGTVGKKITATFTGEFFWRSRKYPRRVLVAENVEDLKVELTKPDEKQ